MRMRDADPSEADSLTELFVRSLGHWGHPENFPALVEQVIAEDRVTSDYVEHNVVRVLVDDEATVGFYGLEYHDEYDELKYMFLEPEYIGRGNGRRLWDDVVARVEPSRPLRIVSDPMAKDFYAAMGARLEREIEVAPGFVLGLMWFER